MNRFYRLFFLLIYITIFFSCQKEQFYNESNAKLRFSKDTITFDTIFTSVGSTTRQLKIYNPYSKTISISSIELAKGNNSCFKLNIDGIPSNLVHDIEISPKDSLFIFVNVTINPGRNKMLEQDSIVFTTNSNKQDIKLIAFGWDVHLINGKILKTQTWTNDKPYLIYNSMLVDTLETLTIEKGTKLFFHKKSALYVKGTLVANGTYDEPIIFQGDRLDDMYFDIPGQWEGIRLLNGSKNNFFQSAEIKNAFIGIQVDTLANLSKPTLTILNSKLEHHSFAGIYAQAATIFAANCLIADCGVYSVALTLGGSYNFYHCTIANYWFSNYSNRITPALFLNDYYTFNNKNFFYPLSKAYFGNCIIYGFKNDEIGFDFFDNGSRNFLFDNCLIHLSESQFNTLDISKFKNIILNQNPDFKAIEKYDYSLNKTSIAKDKADQTITNNYLNFLKFDINGTDRFLDEKPDIGAFEQKSK